MRIIFSLAIGFIISLSSYADTITSCNNTQRKPLWKSLRIGRTPIVSSRENPDITAPRVSMLAVDETFMEYPAFSVDISCGDSVDVSIDGVPMDGGSLEINNAEPGIPHTLMIVNKNTGESFISDSLYFTFLPIVEMELPVNCNSTEYKHGTITLHSPRYPERSDTLCAGFRYRGGTSLNYEKKNYAVKLRNSDGTDLDYTFMDLYDDNDYILDAMAVDKAAMRNRVCTDLWNDIARGPYFKDEEPDAEVGTRGHFVEVVANGVYQGLYCLTEKIQRKLLKLKKKKSPTASVRGVLYKTTSWSKESLLTGWTSGEPKSVSAWTECWNGYEMKYPNVEETAGDWQPLLDMIHWAVSSDKATREDVDRHLDVPLLVDYYLLTEVVNLNDTYGKNTYLYIRDITDGRDGRKMCIIPWDMDASFGRNWDGAKLENTEQIFLPSLNECDYGYFRKFAQGYEDWEEIVDERYSELRSTHFSTSSIIGRFAAYQRLFQKSGADIREGIRWPEYHGNIAADVDYMTDWAARHLEYLDKLHTSASAGLSYVPVDGMAVIGETGGIYIKGSVEHDVTVSDLHGRIVARIPFAEVRRGTHVLGIIGGVYVCEGRKVLVR